MSFNTLSVIPILVAVKVPSINKDISKAKLKI